MIDLIQLAARARTDGTAALALAEARLLGIGCPPDRKAALAAVKQSAALGSVDGRRALIYLTAAGIGRKADPVAAHKMLEKLAAEDRFAAVQLAFLGHLTCERRLAKIEPRIVSADPYIAIFPALFSQAECRYLMTLAMPWLDQAKILDSAGREAIDPMRDADAATPPSLAEDLIVQTINRTIAKASGTEPGWGEPLTVLRYSPGQQYHPHFDIFGVDQQARRLKTALIWLNDQFVGGETHFPTLKLKVRGAVGDMIVFDNATSDGNRDDRMLHAGLPVTSGIKWMASRWIRGADYLKG